MSGTAVPPGTCATHGWHGMTTCPRCSSFAGPHTPLAPRPVPPSDETVDALARSFHETYERLAPTFGYETRRESSVPWEDVPVANRELMRAVVAEVVGPLAALARTAGDLQAENETLRAWEGKPPVSWREETFRLRAEAAVAERDRLRLELDETGECRRLCSPEAEQRATQMESLGRELVKNADKEKMVRREDLEAIRAVLAPFDRKEQTPCP